MSIILNLAVLALCLRWLHQCNQESGTVLQITFAFALGSFISFVIAFLFDSEYLAGVSHLLVAGGSAILFWLISIVLIFKHQPKKSGSQTVAKVLIISSVLIIPWLIHSLISSMSFKIGG